MIKFTDGPKHTDVNTGTKAQTNKHIIKRQKAKRLKPLFINYNYRGKGTACSYLFTKINKFQPNSSFPYFQWLPSKFNCKAKEFADPLLHKCVSLCIQRSLSSIFHQKFLRPTFRYIASFYLTITGLMYKAKPHSWTIYLPLLSSDVNKGKGTSFCRYEKGTW